MSRSIIALITCGGLLLLTAAPASLGFVQSNGQFRINGSGIRGNGTLFEGNVVETLAARSTLQVAGTQMTLLPDSRAKVYRGRIVLEKGSSLTSNLQPNTIDVSNLRVASQAKETQVQVEISNPTRVVVAAQNGAAQVRNSAGVLVAMVLPGTALLFDTQAGGAATAVAMRGTLESHDGKFFLTDKTANITVELQGEDFQKFIGQLVEITGSAVPGAPAAAGASQVVHVVTIKAVTGKKKDAAAAAAGTGVGAGASAGHSATTIAVIVGGVAVVGTVAGLAAVGTFSGSSSSVSVP
jgi:hypothetical protein